MSFVLGIKLCVSLRGVYFYFVKVVECVIQLIGVDFQVYEGLCIRECQVILVVCGVSQIMDLWYLFGWDGFGYVVDFVLLIDFDGDGKVELWWDWFFCYKVVMVVCQVSFELNVFICWGGVWDCVLVDLVDFEDEVVEYVGCCKVMGKKVFLDGFYFELFVNIYFQEGDMILLGYKFGVGVFIGVVLVMIIVLLYCYYDGLVEDKVEFSVQVVVFEQGKVVEKVRVDVLEFVIDKWDDVVKIQVELFE